MEDAYSADVVEKLGQINASLERIANALEKAGEAASPLLILLDKAMEEEGLK